MGDPSRKGHIIKYVVDLDVVPKITEIHIHADQDGKLHVPEEYRCDVTYGANVKALAVALYSEGVLSNDRIAGFLNAAGGGLLGLSAGSVYGFCWSLSEKAEESIRHLEERLLNQEVVATDTTPVTVNGKPNYIRNFSMEDTVVYYAMKSKAIAALEKLDFLKQYTGILVHDHETAMYHFGTGHGEYNVHLLRYLKKNTEETGNCWSEGMAGGVRKESGNEMYCAILSVMETLKRRNMGLIENLKKLFQGTPAIF